MNNKKSLITDIVEKRYARDCLSSFVNELKDKYFWDFQYKEKNINDEVKNAYYSFLDKVSKYDLDNPYDFSLDLYTEDVQELVVESCAISQALDQTLILPHGKFSEDNKGNVITRDGNLIVKNENGKQKIKVIRKK